MIVALVIGMSVGWVALVAQATNALVNRLVSK